MNTLLILCLTVVDPSAGSAGFDFIRIAPTAREAALAGAALGHAESPMAFWYSPALLAAAPSQRAHLGYVNYVGGIHLGSLAYSQPLAADKGIGIGVVYLNSGSMKRTDPLGNELGTFGVSFADFNVSGAMQVTDRISVGIGLQGLYGSIDTFFGLGLAANLGCQVKVPLEGVNGLYAGLACRNLGYQAKAFQTKRDRMPTELGLGLAFNPNPSLNIACDVIKPLDNKTEVRAGIEGWVADLLVLRGGYSTAGVDLKSGGGTDILAGLTTGLGLRYRQYQLDYAFIPMVELGMAHRLSLTLGL